MIWPQEKDIGRTVVYKGDSYIVHSFDDYWVHIQTKDGTYMDKVRRQDLEWLK